jgi:hypothetical protein
MNITIPDAKCSGCGATAPIDVRHVKPLPPSAPTTGPLVTTDSEGRAWRLVAVRPAGWTGETPTALPTEGLCPECSAAAGRKPPPPIERRQPVAPAEPAPAATGLPTLAPTARVEATPQLVRAETVAPAPLTAPYPTKTAPMMMTGVYKPPKPQKPPEVSGIPQRPAPTVVSTTPTPPTVAIGPDIIGAAAVEPTPVRAPAPSSSHVTAAPTQPLPAPSTVRSAVVSSGSSMHTARATTSMPVYSTPQVGGNNRVQAAPPAPVANIKPVLLTTRSVVHDGVARVQATPTTGAPAAVLAQQARPAEKSMIGSIPQQPIAPTVEVTKGLPPIAESAMPTQPIPSLPTTTPTKIS